MVHPLILTKRKIDQSHKGLGGLCVFTALSSKAGLCTLVVAAPGSGKTTALKWIAKVQGEQVIELATMTRSGLKRYEETLTGFEGQLQLSDLGAIDTGYSVREGLKVLALLAYEGKISKLNANTDIEIKDYRGSCLTTCQPSVMRLAMHGLDWDAVLMDKTIRYYHLKRATKPVLTLPEVDLDWGIPREEVTIDKHMDKRIREYIQDHILQWSDPRALEHLRAMVAAAAAFRGSRQVQLMDIQCVLELTAPLQLEQYLSDMEDIGEPRIFLVKDFIVLSELVTYGNVDILRLCKHYRISKRTAQRIVQYTGIWLILDPSGRGRYFASEHALQVLRACGY